MSMSVTGGAPNVMREYLMSSVRCELKSCVI